MAIQKKSSRMAKKERIPKDLTDTCTHSLSLGIRTSQMQMKVLLKKGDLSIRIGFVKTGKHLEPLNIVNRKHICMHS
jgi:hypothetical protein